jgi:dTDP-4-dehydrorhamnose reductase
MRIVVTGAGGMLAHAVLPLLNEAGHEVLGLTRAEADVTDYLRLIAPIRRFQPDWIFHLAAFTRVDDCETDPDRAFLVNALGSRNAAQAAAESEAAVLAISSDYVFDGTASTPYREYHPAAPRSVYGASKWAGEQATREVCPRHVVVRTSWLFGPGGPNFIDTILRKARAGESLRVVDDQRGSPTFTVDLARALMVLATAAQFGTYHVTNAGECTWFDLAAHAIDCAGLTTSLERTTTAQFPRPARRPAYSVLHNLLFQHVTGATMPHWRDAVERHVRAQSAAGSGAAPVPRGA